MAYTLITVSRWLHPATFTPEIALCVLLVGLLATIYSLLTTK